MFDSFENVSYKELTHPDAIMQLGGADPATFDAVIFYDMPRDIKDEEKIVFRKLVKDGKGLLFLHHSICSYQDWNDYKSYTGGKYYEKMKDEAFGVSTYRHDVKFRIQILEKSHPITRGVKDFEILDEVYGNLEVLPGVQPLLATNHPLSNKIIGWTFQKENSRVVYIEPGHDKNAYSNPSYQQLIRQAIIFAAGR